MKKLLILCFIVGFFFQPSEAKKSKGNVLEITYRFDNIIEGYDHETKAEIKINGQEVLISPVHKQSKPQKLTIKVPSGSYDFYLMMWALYEGTWEEHTIANNYSIDCVVDDKFKASKPKHTLNIVFDIDTEETTYDYK